MSLEISTMCTRKNWGGVRGLQIDLEPVFTRPNPTGCNLWGLAIASNWGDGCSLLFTVWKLSNATRARARERWGLKSTPKKKNQAPKSNDI